jgi:type II secretory pathway component GspD/PulD (secretin)
MRKSMKRFGVAMRRGVLMAAVLVSMSPMARAATVIPEQDWPDQSFLRVANEEDVRVTLRAVLDQAGMHLIIRPEIKEVELPISYTDKAHISLKNAFEQLIDIARYSYEYDGRTRTVTLSQPIMTTADFIILELVAANDVKSIVNRFHFNVEVISDDTTHTLMLKGEAEQVAKLRALIAALEASRVRMEKDDFEKHKIVMEEMRIEAEKIRADAEKIKAEAEKAKSETPKAKTEAR